MKKNFISLNLLIGSLVFFGCASRPIVNLTTKFDPILTKDINDRVGKNTILGNSFLRQNGGGIVTCAGNTVYLIPKTPYSTEIVSNIYGNSENGYDSFYSIGVSIPNIPSQYSLLMKKSVCDSQGNFVFDNIGDGEYFLDTKITWIVGNQVQGGSLMQKVKVSQNESKKVILAH